MNKLKLSQDWLASLLPEGLTYPSSTLISGPGGSGKPMIGFAFAYDWLKAGGSVAFIAIQYAETEFVETSMRKIYGMEVSDYADRICYVQFDHNIGGLEQIGKNVIKANLLKPEIWENSVSKAESILDNTAGPGTMVFASALNLLLFSPTYRKLNLDSFEKLLSGDKRRTYLLSVSTSAFGEEIKRWEKAADNLMIARMEEKMQLFLSIEKIDKREVPLKTLKVPVKREILEDIKKVADGTRKRQIPALRKI
jgi:archaellum biogenesis ATPase FlaH